MKCIVFSAAVAVSVAFVASAGTQYTWQSVDSGWSGRYDDSTRWSPATNAYPGAWDEAESRLGDIALFDFRGYYHEGITSEITFPDGVVTNFAGIYYRSTKMNETVFNGTNTVFVMPTPTNGGAWGYDAGAGVPTAFAIGAGSGAGSYLTRVSDGARATWSPGVFSNFLFSVSNAETYRRLLFESGVFAFGYFAYQGFFFQQYNNEPDAFIEVAKDASLITHNTATFGSPSIRNVFTVKGKADFAGQVWMPSSIQNMYKESGVEQEIVLEAREGGRIGLTSTQGFLYMGLSYTLKNVVQNTDLLTCRILADNGTIEQTRSGFAISSNGAGRHELVFRNGSVGSFEGVVKLGNADRSTGVVSVSDSEVSFTSTVTLGGGESAAGILAVTNSEVVFTRPFVLKGGSVSLADGASIRLSRLSSMTAEAADGVAAGFSADGATILLDEETTYDLVSGFTSATIGAGGLTFDTSVDVTVSQSFAGSGTLTLSGLGKKTLAGDIACAKVVVTGGDVDFTGVVTAEVVSTGGAAVSFGGRSTAAAPLAGLCLGSDSHPGRLKLAAGEILYIADGSKVDLTRLFVSLSGEVAENDTAGISVSGDGIDRLRDVWNRVLVKEGLPDGMFWESSVAEGEDFTDFTLTFVPYSPIVVSASSGEETCATNIVFSAGQTLEAHAEKDASLVFDGDLAFGSFTTTGEGGVYLNGAGSEFNCGLTAAGGLLSLGALDIFGVDASVVLSDGTLAFSVPGEFGPTLEINASKADNAMVILKTDADVTMPIPSATRGAIMKRGKGRLTFQVSEDVDWTALRGNDLYNPVEGETIPVDDANGTAPGTDKHYGAVNVAEGELVFRGTGETVPTVAFHQTEKPGTNIGLPTTPAPADLAQPGLVLDHVRYDLSRNPNYLSAFAMTQKLAVDDSSGITAPYLVVTNDAVLECTYFRPAWRNKDARVCAHVLLDNGTINSHYAVYLNEGVNGTPGVVTNFYTLRNGSSLYSRYKNGRMYAVGQTAVVDVDDSVIARDETGAPMSLYATQRDGIVAVFRLRNGSYLGCEKIFMGSDSAGQITSYPYALFDFTFDDSEWYIGEGDRDFPSSNMNVRVTSEGRGLKVNPPAGSTWRLYTRVGGTGGIVKGGEGTLFIDDHFRYQEYQSDSVTLACTGTNVVSGGVLEMKPTAVSAGRNFFFEGDGGVLRLVGENASYAGACVRGTGTLGSGVWSGLRVLPECGEVLTVDGEAGAVLEGRVLFDFEGDSAEAMRFKDAPVVVAGWTGAAPDVSKWRTRNTGVGGRLVFAAEADGTVSAQWVKNGLFIVVQ